MKLIGTCLLTVAAASTSAARAADTRPPNVVLIVSDDHAWTDYGFMGHAHVRTPNLDRLAAQSLVFRRGYVPSSLCCPSLASLISGRYPHQHKITSNDPPALPGMSQAEFQRSAAFRDGREAMCRHLDAVPTLPRLLAANGYLSLQTGKWWQGDYRRGGFTHGMTKGNRHGDDGLSIGRQTMQPIYDFIAAARKEDKPFFVWYAPMMPHTPHTPPARLLDKYKDKTPSIHVARYWAMVEWFDETCGQLNDHLDKQGLAENTIVLYVADNGWFQDPDAGRYAAKSKQSPYDGGLRTPLMVRWPARVQPRMSDDLAMSIDFVPTILAALGQKPPADLPGANLLDEAAVRRRPAIFGECYTHNAVDLNDPAKNLRWRWVIEGRWKLIVPADAAQRSELYDVIADPHETADRAAEQSQTVEALRRRLDAWWRPGPS
jgi:arylsulfatase A-like enzyme